MIGVYFVLGYLVKLARRPAAYNVGGHVAINRAPLSYIFPFNIDGRESIPNKRNYISTFVATHR